MLKATIGPTAETFTTEPIYSVRQAGPLGVRAFGAKRGWTRVFLESSCREQVFKDIGFIVEGATVLSKAVIAHYQEKGFNHFNISIL